MQTIEGIFDPHIKRETHKKDYKKKSLKHCEVTCTTVSTAGFTTGLSTLLPRTVVRRSFTPTPNNKISIDRSEQNQKEF
jgi:hypothetical protein